MIQRITVSGEEYVKLVQQLTLEQKHILSVALVGQSGWEIEYNDQLSLTPDTAHASPLPEKESELFPEPDRRDGPGDAHG